MQSYAHRCDVSVNSPACFNCM